MDLPHVPPCVVNMPSGQDTPWSESMDDFQNGSEDESSDSDSDEAEDERSTSSDDSYVYYWSLSHEPWVYLAIVHKGAANCYRRPRMQLENSQLGFVHSDMIINHHLFSITMGTIMKLTGHLYWDLHRADRDQACNYIVHVDVLHRTSIQHQVTLLFQASW
ncbi:hypothetical protein EDC04DRAFT_458480 [Pisolithus marmoratus]|nr:hypothetical protein EDC04DRAFT_458480 [Pisolithus marmoratus]